MNFAFYQIHTIIDENILGKKKSTLVHLRNGRRDTKPGSAAQTLLSPTVMKATTRLANSERNLKIVIFKYAGLC